MKCVGVRKFVSLKERTTQMFGTSIPTVESVLRSFFLLENPEWQIPLVITLFLAVYAVLEFLAGRLVAWDDRRHRREFMKQYYNDMRAKQRAEKEQQLKDEANSFYQDVYPC